jgi:predicted lipid-binding transport protein (Tim44 family)
MKRYLILLAIVCSCLSLIATSAEAKRLGGGSSIGKQRTISPQQKAVPPSAAPATPAAAPQAAPAGNKWLGPLAGLAIGAGLGAMFAGGLGGMGGLGGALSGILMAVAAGLAVMFIIAWFRKKQQPAMAYAGGAPYSEQPNSVPASALPSSVSASAFTPNAAPGNIPADFPVEAFLRSAKTSFIRLQAANDRKDLDDIREYTTPEMFAEISMQLRDRDNSPQKTDVISVEAQLLEVANENEIAIASVRMTGQLRENNGSPESFDEVWHVQKNLRDANAVWLLSGIQQIV